MPHASLYTHSPKYYHSYFDLVTTDDLMVALKDNLDLIEEALLSIPEERLTYAYAPGKWTIEQVFRHIIETERILSYRALRFSRHDDTPQPGFDENLYIANTAHLRFSRLQLLDDLVSVRSATLSLYSTMNDSMLDFMGTANNVGVSARMIGFMIAGHAKHHLNVIGERY